MSLLDFFGSGWDDPRSGQILGLAQGLLSAPGGRGLAAGIEGMQRSRQNDLRSQLAQLELRGAQRQDQQQQRAMDLDTAMREAAAASYRTPQQANAMSMGPAQDGGAVPQVQPGFDAAGYINRLYGIDPMKAIAVQQSLVKDSQFNKIDPKDFTPDSLAKFAQTRDYGDLVQRSKREVGPAGQVYDPYAVAPGAVLADPNKPFAIGANGAPQANTAYQQYELGKARAGAPSTSVKIENKMGEGIAAQVGPMLRESASVAEGAVKQIDAADRILKALDSNKMYAGTGATIGLTAAQLADSLGFAGKNTQEKIANTRNVIQGLSQLTLQGRQQMRGQGAITESESKLAERAVSGDITLTPTELRILAGAAKRSAAYMQGEHQRKLQVVKSNPDLAGMAPYFDVAPVPAESQQPGNVVDFGSLK